MLGLLYSSVTYGRLNNDFPYKIYPCGDHAATIDFGNVIDETINRQVLQLFKQLKQKNIPGVKDVIPAYSSVTVVYDVVAVRKHTPGTAYNWITQQLEAALLDDVANDITTGNLIKIPACYDVAFAPDLHELAVQKKLHPEEVIQLHCSKRYCVFMLGFLPGFAYMGTVDERINTPRKSIPRTAVPAGSIGIAGAQTGIYPFESPGGWNIIGRTPLKLFDATLDSVTLLHPGDVVQFYPISAEEFEHLKPVP